MSCRGRSRQRLVLRLLVAVGLVGLMMPVMASTPCVPGGMSVSPVVHPSLGTCESKLGPDDSVNAASVLIQADGDCWGDGPCTFRM